MERGIPFLTGMDSIHGNDLRHFHIASIMRKLLRGEYIYYRICTIQIYGSSGF